MANDNKNTTKKPKFNAYWIYGLIGVFLIFLIFTNDSDSSDKVSYSKFKELIEYNDVETIKVTTNNTVAEIFLKEGAAEKDAYKGLVNKKSSFLLMGGESADFTIKYLNLKNFEDYLNEIKEEKKLDFEIESTQQNNSISNFIFSILPFVLIIGVWIFIMRRMSGGGAGGGGGQIFNIGKSKAKLFDEKTDIKSSFKDVAGLEGAKEEVQEIVDFLKNPEKYTSLGGKIPKGALLVGPPGTGKTLLAKAVAGEAQVPFFSLSGSDFVEMFVGVGASRVRDLFKQAKEKSPAIIFIDEIDAIGRARGKNNFTGSNDERENTLNQLLTEMDGFGTNTNVIVMAATNRADILDKALMRAGRFDRQIYVDLPDLNERKEIFEVHLKPLKKADNLDTDFLSKQTPGFSGADIANVCNEAALIAARKGKKAVEKQDFLDAVDRIVGGLEKKNKIIKPEEKRRIAYHEAGHATISWMTEHADPLVKVTIVPRGQALGAAWYLPEERQITTKEQLLDKMCSLLGGRAAEEVEMGNYSTGAQNDLERTTKQASAMVTIYGLSDEIGHLSYYDSSGQSDQTFLKPYSEKTAEKIDAEIRKMIDEQYARAIQILTNNKDKLTTLAELLLEKEVIFKDDLERIFGARLFTNSDEISDSEE
ncbi:ATP-dependent zinc metalloprotease FtsH [Kordia antarctica]|uniref:ATP-dependent zinc metalloprotease FtsH n=1 Tax=Kordia antarctica TaxID=1218801 RepID=A0A7L4ZR02_9FLAO|nr:ATP-dependent zinc metalloprotease FtsH [Kordia antarctica]QHI38626.1 ATP-dependent zinc metalloprotease FtsH [Kordia antarctica]